MHAPILDIILGIFILERTRPTVTVFCHLFLYIYSHILCANMQNSLHYHPTWSLHMNSNESICILSFALIEINETTNELVSHCIMCI